MADESDQIEDTKFVGDEEEELFEKDIRYEVNAHGADFMVDGLVSKMKSGDIKLLDFQRRFVWTPRRSSRFIESILLGLPVPGIFLYREERTEELLIVDGHQRLATLRGFYEGKFPDTDRTFRLKGVVDNYEGRSFKDLDERQRRQFENTIIHATIIRQQKPKDEKESAYHIFDRLNSNSTPLQPQEIRTAVYHGKFQELLYELNNTCSWRNIFGHPHKRAKDQELILRFLALKNELKNYKKPMIGFLNEFMEANRYLDDDVATKYRKQFVSTIDKVYESIGVKAFKPRRMMNVSVFDSVMVAVHKHLKTESSSLNKAYSKLIKDAEYIRVCTEATSDEINVHKRIKLAMEKFDEAA